MMEDFNDSPQRAREALAAAASKEAEVRSTGRGPVPCDRLLQAASGGVPSRQARLLHRQRPEGDVPSGSGAPLETPPPPRAGGRRTRSPSTRPPHVPDPRQEGCTEGARQRRRGMSTRARHDQRSAVVFRFVFGHLSCTLLCLF
jgi:hypothetical protein